MSYVVEYNPELRKRYPAKKAGFRKPSVKLVFILFFAVVAGYTAIRMELLRYLIPGDSYVTSRAFSEMVEQIGAGEPINACISAFCREIIAGSIA